MKNIQPLHLILGGFGLAIISVFLPWASVSVGKELAAFATAAGGSASNSVSGLKYSNLSILALILMAGAIGSCYAKVPGKTKLLATGALAAGGLAALLILIDFFRILTTSSGDLISVSVGIGLYLAVIGVAAGTYGAFLRWQKTPADPVAAGPPAGGPPPQP